MLSFIIPALNEAEHIERCVTSIRRYVPPPLLHEIIVVDNGSDDGTDALAERAGARVLPSSAPTIGAVRNEGVAVSSGDVLVFLDADCALTPPWGEEIEGVLARLNDAPLSCAGSQVTPPADESVFLWDYWFLPFVRQETASHLGSAHLLCSRETFTRLGGFDERLETGEDYDLCRRIRQGGGEVINVPALRVEHFDFPRTWGAFIRRERWYGKEDLRSFSSFRASRVAVMSALFVGLLLASVVTILAGLPWLSLLALAAAAALVVATSVVKFGHAGLRVQTMSMMIIPAYFLARTLAVLDVWERRNRAGGRP